MTPYDGLLPSDLEPLIGPGFDEWERTVIMSCILGYPVVTIWGCRNAGKTRLAAEIKRVMSILDKAPQNPNPPSV